ncbi:hypothetical protein AGMMS49938_18250 [Fibrobacterales bacterium]|nr:hypothetical protein AGMMS49938_18250 [Fibrobacterales bacterium]
MISSVGKDEVYIKSLAHIPQIIENMHYADNMPNAKNNGYSNFDYYLTPIKIDGKNYTILSDVGKNENGEYYYSQQVFEGTVKDNIKKVRGLTVGDQIGKSELNSQAPSENARALATRTPARKAGTDRLDLAALPTNPKPSVGKYSKFLEIMQSIYGKNFEKWDNLVKNTEQTTEQGLNLTENGGKNYGQGDKKTAEAREKEPPMVERKGNYSGEFETNGGKTVERAKQPAGETRVENVNEPGEIKKQETEETKFDTFSRKIQDSLRDLKKLSDLVKNKDRNAYDDYDLMHGKKEWGAMQLRKKFVEPIQRIILAYKLDVKDVDDYLYALHAPDVNKYLQESKGVKDGSGMSDEKAKEILQKAKDTKNKIAKALFEV